MVQFIHQKVMETNRAEHLGKKYYFQNNFKQFASTFCLFSHLFLPETDFILTFYSKIIQQCFIQIFLRKLAITDQLTIYQQQSMSNKKGSKKEQEKLAELEREMEEVKREQERKSKQARLKQLAQKSAPLSDYGLLDAYQFFLSQLANSGIPQGNVFQFAAQSLLKFEKGKIKKQSTLKQVQKVNKQAVKVVSESSPTRSKSRVQRELKPQLLPFKGELNSQQLQFLGRR